MSKFEAIIERPEQISVTLRITMTNKEWADVRVALMKDPISPYAVHDLSRAIYSLVGSVHKHFNYDPQEDA